MVQTATRLKDEIGERAGELTARARELPDSAVKTGRKASKQAKKQSKHLAQAAQKQPKSRRLGAPAIVMLVLLGGGLALRSRRGGHKTNFESEPTNRSG